ncbi:pyocin activator PrtN family protein [Vibrio cholerae]|uniref:pyocin activator PrtN family protein n=1 Tax=Vibrio cholerae TaxID=666 RepID=UPI001C9CFE15|nr:pyocin activator PrtN family protein [Vibrio cholerae]MBY7976331.1 pyocin activator PrtN family protein [Vibrio fluvialis]
MAVPHKQKGWLMTKNNNVLSITHHIVMAQFGYRALIPLEELSGAYLGLSVNTAKRKAKSNLLPFPTLKLDDSQKSPYYVHINDLVKFIDEKAKRSRDLWNEYQFDLAS